MRQACQRALTVLNTAQISRLGPAREPPEFDQRDGKVAHDIADAADLAAGQRAIFGCEKEYGARVDRVLPCVMQLLPEHVGRDQRDAFLRYPEAALPICIVVFADYRPVRDVRARIDDATREAALGTDLDVGQYDTLGDF